MIHTRPVTCTRCGRAWRLTPASVAFPGCGESPANYAVGATAFCGLHEVPMVPCRMTGRFLRSTFTEAFRQASAQFPNANLDGPAAEGDPESDAFDAHCCPECQRLLASWHARRAAGAAGGG